MTSSQPLRSSWLGLDLGTSAVKALLVDSDGGALASAREPLALQTPTPLAAEQDAEAWWAACVRATRRCLDACPAQPVAGVGLTGQKHALLALGADDVPLAPAVLWADGRAVPEAAQAERLVGRLSRRTGAPALPGYVVPKWLRLTARKPHLAPRVRRLCFAKDWIRLRLTGAFATDRTEAAASQLWNASRRAWSEVLCEAYGVPLEILPRVVASADEAGRVGVAGAGATGLAPGTPVVGGAGDNEAAALACGAVDEGMAAVVLGTSGTVCAPVLRRMRRSGRGLVWGPSALRRGSLATGVVLSAGRALDWIRAAAFGEEARIEDVLAAAGEAHADAPIFLPSLAGERSPDPDPEASGAFGDLRPHHRRSDLAAAVLRGVSAQIGRVVTRMREVGIGLGEIRLTSGGAASPLWRRLIAASTALPVRVVGEDEGPARGAALLAACRGASDARLLETAQAWARAGEPVTAPAEEIRRQGKLADRLGRLAEALRRSRL